MEPRLCRVRSIRRGGALLTRRLRGSFNTRAGLLAAAARSFSSLRPSTGENVKFIVCVKPTCNYFAFYILI